MKHSAEVLHKIWERASTVPTHDPRIWRKDPYGAWIISFLHGDRSSPFGWEVFGEEPPVGTRTPQFLPFQWENYDSRSKGNSTCVIRGRGEENRRSIPRLRQRITRKRPTNVGEAGKRTAGVKKKITKNF